MTYSLRYRANGQKGNDMAYYVKYRMHSAADVKGISVVAKNKVEAYEKAVYEAIPKIEGSLPFSAWVYEVTYANGKRRFFNTCEGLPY